MAAVRRSLPPDVREFLQTRRDYLRGEIGSHLLQRNPQLIDTLVQQDAAHPDGTVDPLLLPEVSNYLDNALLSQPDEIVDQHDAFVPVELRQFGQTMTQAAKARELFAELAALARSLYESAVHSTPTVPQPALSAVLTNLTGAGEFDLTLHEAWPEPGPSGVNPAEQEYLVRSADFTLVAESRGGKAILRIATQPMDVHKRERRGRSKDAVFAAVRDAVARLGRAGTAGLTLVQLFPEVGRFDIHPDAGDVVIRSGEGLDEQVSVEYAMGVPPRWLYDFLRNVRDGMRSEQESKVRAKKHLDGGLSLADQLANQFDGDDGDRWALRGYLALVYTQFAAVLESVGTTVPARRNALAVSRPGQSEVRTGLPSRVREFLELNAEWIRDTFVIDILTRNEALTTKLAETLRPLRYVRADGRVDLLRLEIGRTQSQQSFTVRHYLNNALIGVPRVTVEQAAALGVGRPTAHLDRYDGRDAPLVVLDLPSYGSEYMSVEQILDFYAQLETSARGSHLAVPDDDAPTFDVLSARAEAVRTVPLSRAVFGDIMRRAEQHREQLNQILSRGRLMSPSDAYALAETQYWLKVIIGDRPPFETVRASYRREILDLAAAQSRPITADEADDLAERLAVRHWAEWTVRTEAQHRPAALAHAVKARTEWERAVSEGTPYQLVNDDIAAGLDWPVASLMTTWFRSVAEQIVNGMSPGEPEDVEPQADSRVMVELAADAARGAGLSTEDHSTLADFFGRLEVMTCRQVQAGLFLPTVSIMISGPDAASRAAMGARVNAIAQHLHRLGRQGFGRMPGARVVLNRQPQERDGEPKIRLTAGGLHYGLSDVIAKSPALPERPKAVTAHVEIGDVAAVDLGLSDLAVERIARFGEEVVRTSGPLRGDDVTSRIRVTAYRLGSTPADPNVASAEGRLRATIVARALETAIRLASKDRHGAGLLPPVPPWYHVRRFVEYSHRGPGPDEVSWGVRLTMDRPTPDPSGRSRFAAERSHSPGEREAYALLVAGFERTWSARSARLEVRDTTREYADSVLALVDQQIGVINDLAADRGLPERLLDMTTTALPLPNGELASVRWNDDPGYRRRPRAARHMEVVVDAAGLQATSAEAIARFVNELLGDGSGTVPAELTVSVYAVGGAAPTHAEAGTVFAVVRGEWDRQLDAWSERTGQPAPTVTLQSLGQILANPPGIDTPTRWAIAMRPTDTVAQSDPDRRVLSMEDSTRLWAAGELRLVRMMSERVSGLLSERDPSGVSPHGHSRYVRAIRAIERGRRPDGAADIGDVAFFAALHRQLARLREELLPGWRQEAVGEIEEWAVRAGRSRPVWTDGAAEMRSWVRAAQWVADHREELWPEPTTALVAAGQGDEEVLSGLGLDDDAFWAEVVRDTVTLWELGEQILSAAAAAEWFRVWSGAPVFVPVGDGDGAGDVGMRNISELTWHAMHDHRPAGFPHLAPGQAPLFWVSPADADHDVNMAAVNAVAEVLRRGFRWETDARRRLGYAMSDVVVVANPTQPTAVNRSGRGVLIWYAGPVRPPAGWADGQLRVWFDGPRELSAQSRADVLELVRTVARAAVLRAQAGMSMPMVTIASPAGQADAENHVEQVRLLIRSQLPQAIKEAEEHIPGLSIDVTDLHSAVHIVRSPRPGVASAADARPGRIPLPIRIVLTDIEAPPAVEPDDQPPQVELRRSERMRASITVLANGVLRLADPLVPQDASTIDALVTLRSLPAEPTRLVLALPAAGARGPTSARLTWNGAEVSAGELSELLDILRRDGIWTSQDVVLATPGASIDGAQAVAAEISALRGQAVTSLGVHSSASQPWQEWELDGLVDVIRDRRGEVRTIWVRSPAEAADRVMRSAATSTRIPDGFVAVRISGHNGRAVVDGREIDPEVLLRYLRRRKGLIASQSFLEIPQALEGGAASFAVRWQAVTKATVRASRSVVWTSPSTGAVMASAVRVHRGLFEPAFSDGVADADAFVDLLADGSERPAGSIHPPSRTASTITDWVDLLPAYEPLTLVSPNLVVALHIALDMAGPAGYRTVVDTIHAASTAQRQAALADTDLGRLFRERLTPGQRLVVYAALLEGSLSWKNPPNDFTRNYDEAGPAAPLPFTASANRWEFVLETAGRAGVIEPRWIKEFIRRIGTDNDPLILSILGWTRNLPRYGQRTPQPGQLLFYVGSNARYPAHVAIYIGGGEALSLGTGPNNTWYVQRVRVSEFGGSVYVADPPWSALALTAAGLAEVVSQAVRADPGADDPSRSSVLLQALSRSLYPTGVRSMETLDDNRLGTPFGEQFASMLGWPRIESWDALRAAVTDAGPGATGFVLVDRPGVRRAGHAFALHHTSDGGLRWIELSGAPGHQLLRDAPPGRIGLETLGLLDAAVTVRALVVDARGRALTDAFRPALESASVARAMVDAGHGGYGAVAAGGPAGTDGDHAAAGAANGNGQPLSLSQPSVAAIEAAWTVAGLDELQAENRLPILPAAGGGVNVLFPGDDDELTQLVDAVRLLPVRPGYGANFVGHARNGVLYLYGRRVPVEALAEWWRKQNIAGDVFLALCELLTGSLAQGFGGFGVQFRDMTGVGVLATNMLGWLEPETGTVIAAGANNAGQPTFDDRGRPTLNGQPALLVYLPSQPGAAASPVEQSLVVQHVIAKNWVKLLGPSRLLARMSQHQGRQIMARPDRVARLLGRRPTLGPTRAPARNGQEGPRAGQVRNMAWTQAGTPRTPSAPSPVDVAPKQPPPREPGPGTHGSGLVEFAGDVTGSVQVLSNQAVFVVDPAVAPGDEGLVQAYLKARSLPPDPSRLRVIVHTASGGVDLPRLKWNGQDLTRDVLGGLLDQLRRDGLWTRDVPVELVLPSVGEVARRALSAWLSRRLPGVAVTVVAGPPQTPTLQESDLMQLVEPILNDDGSVRTVWVRSRADGADRLKKLAAQKAYVPDGTIGLLADGHNGIAHVNGMALDAALLHGFVTHHLGDRLAASPSDWFLMVSQAARRGPDSFAWAWRTAAGGSVWASPDLVFIDPVDGAVTASKGLIVNGGPRPSVDQRGKPDGEFQHLPLGTGPPVQVSGAVFSASRTISAVEGWVDTSLSHSYLTAALHAAAKLGGRVDVSWLADMIHRAPVGQRQAALTESALLLAIRTQLPPRQAFTIMAALLEGSLNWQSSSIIPSTREMVPNDFYQHFVLDRRDVIPQFQPAEATANSLESGMYAAYMAGLVDQAWIQHYYAMAMVPVPPDPAERLEAERRRNERYWSAAGWKFGLPRYPSTTPRPGDLLFFTPPGETLPFFRPILSTLGQGVVAMRRRLSATWHWGVGVQVAISLGGDWAISLGDGPNGIRRAQRINVNDVAGTVYIADPPWLNGQPLSPAPETAQPKATPLEAMRNQLNRNWHTIESLRAQYDEGRSTPPVTSPLDISPDLKIVAANRKMMATDSEAVFDSIKHRLTSRGAHAARSLIDGPPARSIGALREAAVYLLSLREAMREATASSAPESEAWLSEASALAERLLATHVALYSFDPAELAAFIQGDESRRLLYQAFERMIDDVRAAHDLLASPEFDPSTIGKNEEGMLAAAAQLPPGVVRVLTANLGSEAPKPGTVDAARFFLGHGKQSGPGWRELLARSAIVVRKLSEATGGTAYDQLTTLEVQAGLRLPSRRRPPVPARDLKELEHAFERARQAWPAGTEPELPYVLRNAMAGLSDPRMGRAFGWEIEFELPGESSLRSFEEIVHEMKRLGLIKKGWRPHPDGLAYEISSPPGFDRTADNGGADHGNYDQMFTDLLQVLGLLKGKGAQFTNETGIHFNVSSGDYTHDNYLALIGLLSTYEDLLHLLFLNFGLPNLPSRGLRFARPNVWRDPVDGRVWDARNGRYWTLNIHHDLRTASRVEWRLGDGIFDPGTIQALTLVAVALTSSAARMSPSDINPSTFEPVGTHRAQGEIEPSAAGVIPKIVEMLADVGDNERIKSVVMLAAFKKWPDAMRASIDRAYPGVDEGVPYLHEPFEPISKPHLADVEQSPDGGREAVIAPPTSGQSEPSDVRRQPSGVEASASRPSRVDGAVQPASVDTRRPVGASPVGSVPVGSKPVVDVVAPILLGAPVPLSGGNWSVADLNRLLGQGSLRVTFDGGVAKVWLPQSVAELFDKEFGAGIRRAVPPRGYVASVFVHGKNGEALLYGLPLRAKVLARWLRQLKIEGPVFLAGCELVTRGGLGGFGVQLRDEIKNRVRATPSLAWLDPDTGDVIAAPAGSDGKPVFAGRSSAGRFYRLPANGGRPRALPRVSVAEVNPGANWKALLFQDPETVSDESRNGPGIGGRFSGLVGRPRPELVARRLGRRPDSPDHEWVEQSESIDDAPTGFGVLPGGSTA